MTEETEVLDATAEGETHEVETVDQPPEDQESAPETTPGEDAAAEIRNRAEKRASGVQKRIDELVREREDWKRLAMQRMEQQQPEPSPQARQPEGKPAPAQFDSYDEYLEALTDWKVEQREVGRIEREQREAAHRQQRDLVQRTRQKLAEAAERYDDFHEVVTASSLQITPVMAAAIADTDRGGDVAYYLGKHPQEASRIAGLSPYRQAVEIGRIEARLESSPPKPTATNAPEPIRPAKAAARAEADPDKMSVSDWLAWRNKQLKG